MIISLAAGAAMIFSPGDENGIGKYIKYVVSLIIIITLLVPFKDIIYMIPKVLSDDMSILSDSSMGYASDDFYDEIIEMSVSEIEKAISGQIKNSHGTDVVAVYAETDHRDVENIIITEIKILFGEETNSEDAERICKELEKEYQCIIEYEIDNSGGGK